MTGDNRRLIEVAFPLEQVSLDSEHEKNVRHGHISTLHIWPARRPLAACRAVLIATLLPDPGDAAERREIYRRLAGEVVESVKTETRGGRTVERRRRETRGGILHWGREGDADVDWFRTRIREAYGGRAPKVLDPFAGGGAIPLEAMRLGCEATAVDINPVAWFILKCTLDYPHRLAGTTLPLPEFVRGDRDFMEAFLKARGFKGKTLARQLEKLGLVTDGGEIELALIDHDAPPDADLFSADLAWQVRAWGRRVLARVWAALASDRGLSDRFEVLSRSGRASPDAPEDDETGEADADGGSGGGKVKLVPWIRHKAKWLGYEGPGGRPVPLIDRAHRLMHLWRAGEEGRVNDYIDDNGLARHALFARLLQALIELAPANSEERALLESLSNHIAARVGLAASRQAALGLEAPA